MYAIMRPHDYRVQSHCRLGLVYQLSTIGGSAKGVLIVRVNSSSASVYLQNEGKSNGNVLTPIVTFKWECINTYCYL